MRTAAGLQLFLRNAQENIISQMSEKKKVLQVPVGFSDVFFVHMYLLILFLQ